MVLLSRRRSRDWEHGLHSNCLEEIERRQTGQLCIGQGPDGFDDLERAGLVEVGGEHNERAERTHYRRFDVAITTVNEAQGRDEKRAGTRDCIGTSVVHGISRGRELVA